jgi:predicted O-methyltransferase YrrM
VLDDRVRAVLARLEEEDRREREQGVARELRARQVEPTTGRFLFSLVAPQWDAEVLEIGGSRGYSTIWLAAGARILGGHVLSLEADPLKIEAWRRNIADAGLEEWADMIEGDAFETLQRIEDIYDTVFLDAEKDDYEGLFELARKQLEPGAVVIADNVLSHVDTLGAYSAARQADPTTVSVTVPLDRGLEITTVLTDGLDEDSPPAALLRSRVPRKGGGPDVTDSSSTGSGGTSG